MKTPSRAVRRCHPRQVPEHPAHAAHLSLLDVALACKSSPSWGWRNALGDQPQTTEALANATARSPTRSTARVRLLASVGS